MGLSEREQALLDEMERRLYQSEADVMQTVGSSRVGLNLRSLVLGIVVGLVGIGVLVGGVATQQLWLGVIGFAIMLGGTLLALSKRESAAEAPSGAGASGSAAKVSTQESFNDRMQRRWDERMEGER